MGVTSVFQWPSPPDTQSGEQALEQVYTMLELRGGINDGAYTVDCDTYQTSIGISLQKVLYILHDTDYPMSTFALVEPSTQAPATGAPTQQPASPTSGTMLVADHMFDLILANMSNIYTCKKSVRVECTGRKYRMGDFILKVGSVTMGTNVRGILVEAGCCNMSEVGGAVAGWENLKRFIQHTLEPPAGAVLTMTPPHQLLGRPHQLGGMGGLPPHAQPHTPKDTMLQYLDLFNMMRRATGAATAPTGTGPNQ